MRAYRDTIEKIHTISNEMWHYSQHDDWEKVAESEQERQLLLSQLANIEVQEFDPVSEKLLQKIIAINEEIETLSRQKMEICQQEYNEVKNKKNAISAYSSF